MNAPNGHFVRDLILFNGLAGFASKGFIFEAPDLQNAQISDLNEFQDQVSLLLVSLNENQRLQVQWFCDCDYRKELLRYNEETRRCAGNDWSRMQRNERFLRYWNMMGDRKLRRERLILYVSRKIDIGLHGSRQYEVLLDQLVQEFAQVHDNLTNIFSGQGARIIPMTDENHYRHYASFLNPSYAQRFDYDPAGAFEPEQSIQENCWHCAGKGQRDFGFYLDGNYHSMLVLTRWPKVTFPGIVRRLTNLGLLDYTITVNVAPLPVREEISKEERAHDRIAGDYASEHKLRLITVMEKKQKKIAALMSGQTLPFRAQYIIRVWDEKKETLIAKTNAIKNAINSMNSAQYFETVLEPSSRKLFFQSWPGWTWGRYAFYELYAENRYLADMLPFSSTFTGHLESAEAIYNGESGNLVGVKTFAGGAPQHAVMLGMSGSGKSVNACDLLTQTEPYFGYTVLIEEGLSYGIYTQTVEPGARPIVLHPNGDLTINYLDTQGLPLSGIHRSTVTALVARMAGVSLDEDKQLLRQARIAKLVNVLYSDVYQDWSQRNPALVVQVARHACALRAYQREKLPLGSSVLEAFSQFREWSLTHPEEAENYLTAFKEGQVLKFLKDPESARDVQNLAFAYFKPEEYPTHRMLQELMQLDADDEVAQLATLLLPWCADGNYGALFDGQSNITLTGKIVHFELGCIPDSAHELRAAAGFLITHYTRNHIITLPRSIRKRIVYEEVARFLDIPGGEKIVAESYAQMRKFNCWNLSIIQQYSRFKGSRIRASVFGNSRMFFMMKQSDRGDLEDIGHDIAIPEITKATIMSYPLPDQQVSNPFSAFTYYHLDNQRPLIGTVQNVASPEMLFCSSSSGELFDSRAKALKSYDDILEGIVRLSEKQQTNKP